LKLSVKFILKLHSKIFKWHTKRAVLHRYYMRHLKCSITSLFYLFIHFSIWNQRRPNCKLPFCRHLFLSGFQPCIFCPIVHKFSEASKRHVNRWNLMGTICHGMNRQEISSISIVILWRNPILVYSHKCTFGQYRLNDHCCMQPFYKKSKLWKVWVN